MSDVKPLVIEVPPGSEPVHIVGSKDGRSWDFWTQTAYATSIFDGFPNRIELQISDGRAYPPGHYVLAQGALQQGRGTQFVSGTALIPVAEAAKFYADLAGPASRPAPVRAAS